MIQIYHNPRCSKSREGKEILEESGNEFEIVEYMNDSLSVKELKELIRKLGIHPMDLIRKNENIWKEDFKDKNLSEDEILQAMHEFPNLIERPIVVNGSKAIIGRPPILIKDIL